MNYIEKIDIKSHEGIFLNNGIFPLLVWFFNDFIKIRKKLKTLSVKRKRSNIKKIRKYKSTFSGPDMAIGIIAIILLGIRSFEEIDVKFHTERRVAEILGLKRFFDKTYARKFLSEFNLFHIKQLDNINTLILKEFGDSFNQKIGILDIDLAIRHIENKKNANGIIGSNRIKPKIHYYYIWGICSIKEEIISQKLDQGKENSDRNFISLIEDAKSKLRLNTMVIRVNSEYISLEILNYCVKEGIQIISYMDWDQFFSNNKDLDTNNLNGISFKEEANEKGAKVIRHIKIVELGERSVYRTCKCKFKSFAVEIEKEKTKIKKSRNRLKYVIIHNIHGLRGERASFEFYHQRQTIKNIFKESKNPFNSGKMPSKKFRANEAYLNFVALSYNLLTIFRKNICQIYGKDTVMRHLEI